MAMLTVKTQVLHEEIIDAAPEAEGPGVPVFEIQGGALYSQAASVDAAGQTHHVYATGLVENSNITFADYRIVPRHPGPFPAQPYARIEPTQKIDAVTLTHTGDMVLVYLTTHAPGPGPRTLRVELAVIPGVWRTTAQHEAEEGGEGAYRGGDVLPEPEVDVDYGRIEAIVEFQLNQKLGEFRNEFGADGNIRQALEEKAKDAQVELFDPTDPRGRIYRDALFQFVKNANAGVQANILGGQDSWGQARRDELKAALREVLREIDEPGDFEVVDNPSTKPKGWEEEEEA